MTELYLNVKFYSYICIYINSQCMSWGFILWKTVVPLRIVAYVIFLWQMWPLKRVTQTQWWLHDLKKTTMTSQHVKLCFFLCFLLYIYLKMVRKRQPVSILCFWTGCKHSGLLCVLLQRSDRDSEQGNMSSLASWFP